MSSLQGLEPNPCESGVKKGRIGRSNKGVYTLLISVPSGLSLKVGKLGRVRLKKGIYIYTGSALGPGGLEKRLRRHLGRKKKRFWHVDYLLASGNAHVKAIAFAPTYGRAVCRLNKS
ncbi:MAG: GIY-YIG nuclease family protein, partial [Thermoproteota archaeon]